MDAKLPLISVIVPIYNVQEYLERCIASVCAQTYQNLQIILVDDGSTDNSCSICHKYQRTDDRILLIQKTNGGLVSARKAGIEVSYGEYISFVDGDDWIDENTFELLTPYLQEPVQPDVIAYGCIEEYTDYKIYKKNSLKEGTYTGEALELLKKNILMGETFFDWKILPHLCDKVIKKSLLQQCIKNVPNEISFGEDAACTFPCIIKADSICSLDIVPYHYIQREGSIVKEKKELKKENFQCIYTVLKNAFCVSWELELQLKYYMFFILCLKAYSKIGSSMILFPFQEVKQSSRILIYGAGGFGKVIEEYVNQSNDLYLTGWTDQRADEYRKQGYQINSFEILFEENYDYLVIAILNEKTASKIKKHLVQQGIREDKIVHVSQKVLAQQGLPDWL